MFHFDRQVTSLRLPVEVPVRTGFTIRLEPKAAAVVRALADRSGATPEQVLVGLVTVGPFQSAVSLSSSEWVTQCPDTKQDVPADMTRPRNRWFDDMLYSINLLRGEALQRYRREHDGADGDYVVCKPK